MFRLVQEERKLKNYVKRKENFKNDKDKSLNKHSKLWKKHLKKMGSPQSSTLTAEVEGRKEFFFNHRYSILFSNFFS